MPFVQHIGGQSILEPEVTGKMMLKMRQKNQHELHEELTGREMEILLLIDGGKKQSGNCG